VTNVANEFERMDGDASFTGPATQAVSPEQNSVLDAVSLARVALSSHPWGLNAPVGYRRKAASLRCHGGVAEALSQPVPKQQEIAPRQWILRFLRVLGQLKRVYLACEGEDAVYFIYQTPRTSASSSTACVRHFAPITSRVSVY